MLAVTDRAEARRLQRTAQKCGREDLPLARGQGRRPRGATPPVQGAMAAWLQEGGEELFHVQGQEGRL